jgi:hypothetical protein
VSRFQIWQYGFNVDISQEPGEMFPVKGLFEGSAFLWTHDSETGGKRRLRNLPRDCLNRNIIPTICLDPPILFPFIARHSDWTEESPYRDSFPLIFHVEFRGIRFLGVPPVDDDQKECSKISEQIVQTTDSCDIEWSLFYGVLHI